LGPAHCDQGGAGDKGRDYAWTSPRAGLGFVGRARRATRSLAAGATVWIERDGAWSQATVEQAHGAAYWLALRGAPACPGDSGAPVWALEDGRPKWVAMLVSGALTRDGCAVRASALKTQGVDWGSAP
jgi:hypothetical protein